MQALWKIAAQLAGECRSREETNGRLAEQVTEGLEAGIRGYRARREHQIEPVRRQLAEQTLERTLVTQHVEGSIARQQRFENAPGDEFRHRIGDTDGYRPPATRAGAPQHAGELEAAREDFLGIRIGDAPEFRGHEASTLLLEQRALPLSFEQLDLAAHGLRRQVQGRCRLRHAALADDGPEVQQVGVVRMTHGLTLQ